MWSWVVPLLAFSWMVLAAGCQMSSIQTPSESGSAQATVRLNIGAPDAWGGEMRCREKDCYLGVVEHETSKLALHRVSGRKSVPVDRQPLAYHPDSAIWLADDILVAAVEDSDSLDIFKMEQDRLLRVQQIGIAFHPRDVILLEASENEYQMLAVPYSGKKIAWVRWKDTSSAAAQVQWADWCSSPWHPVKVGRTPQFDGAGIAVACLDDRRVVVVPRNQLMAEPKTLAIFQNVPRQVRPSPSGKWLYVALEVGGKNARIDMDTGKIQMLDAHEAGSVSVAPISDDTVVWGGDHMLQIQRINADGTIREMRWLRSSGFSSGLQLIDVDRDGEQDIVVLNSAGNGVDIIYGPLWDSAGSQLPN